MTYRLDIDKIKNAMADNRWNARSLAFAAGIHDATVRLWLGPNGVNPGVLGLKKICDVLGFSVDDVLVADDDDADAKRVAA